MGWTNSHLYQFEIHGQQFTDLETWEPFDDDEEPGDTELVRLRDLHLKEGIHFTYLYDFGDYWLHDVVVEDIVPQSLVEDPTLAEIFVRELSSPGSISGGDRVRLDTLLQGMFISLENILKMAQDGTIERRDWEPWSRHLRLWLKNPAVRAWWDRQRTPFGQDFRAHVETLLAQEQGVSGLDHPTTTEEGRADAPR